LVQEYFGYRQEVKMQNSYELGYFSFDAYVIFNEMSGREDIPEADIKLAELRFLRAMSDYGKIPEGKEKGILDRISYLREGLEAEI
jgi:hypothetical protein